MRKEKGSLNAVVGSNFGLEKELNGIGGQAKKAGKRLLYDVTMAYDIDDLRFRLSCIRPPDLQRFGKLRTAQ